MKSPDPPDRCIKTAGQVFNIVETVQNLNGATFTELSEHIETSESTLYDYLATLSHLGYLSKENGTYNLSLQFFDLGISARNRHPILSKSQSILKHMAEESGAAVWLMVEEAGKAVYLEREFGERSIETHERLGKHEFMHCLASGKAMLAFAPEEHVQNVVDRYGLPKKTPESITSLEELNKELSTIREQGYAINRRETVEGVSAVAAPIVANDRLYGAVAIAGPEARLESEAYQQEMIGLVTTASNEIELRLTYE